MVFPVADPEAANCDVHARLQRRIDDGGLLVIEMRANPWAAAIPGVARQARGAHAAVPTYKTRLVVLKPVRDVWRAATEELAAEHRQRAVDVSFARDWEALVGEACHGQVRPLAVIAR